MRVVVGQCAHVQNPGSVGNPAEIRRGSRYGRRRRPVEGMNAYHCNCCYEGYPQRESLPLRPGPLAVHTGTVRND
ncbi:hypothetical protein GCM10007304_00870 [Rhodococcoides trifolii]|uniref:Uncharacterized protein n=1 Tax=Rhodococcoides trifolii TaxID=908250 RepID=A0A917FLC5_9NOCA|nr:hypothetical protein GCM10007304_00870 [Rhodococcus trifolii]